MLSSRLITGIPRQMLPGDRWPVLLFTPAVNSEAELTYQPEVDV